MLAKHSVNQTVREKNERVFCALVYKMLNRLPRFGNAVQMPSERLPRKLQQ